MCAFGVSCIEYVEQHLTDPSFIECFLIVKEFASGMRSKRAHAVYGSAQQVQSQLEELRSVGAHYVLLSGNDSGQSMRRFGEQILPNLSVDLD